jgi:NodT family efflux transporter outer membrane factor (OMF) lipoprotein
VIAGSGMAWRGLATGALALVLAGCLVGPDYKRPQTGPPVQFRFASPQELDRASVADLAWFELFRDDALRELIQTALIQNYDLQIATARVLQARAQIGIVRSQLFPTIGASGSGQTLRFSQNVFNFPSTADPQITFGTLALDMTWEIDVWGRIRRLTESARAELFSNEETRRAVFITLIANVATAYFQLRTFDLQLAISRRTIEARERGLKLVQTQRDLGVGTGLDVAQAEDLLFTARAVLKDTERQIAQTEDLLSLLLGQNPGDIIRGRTLDETAQALPPDIPPGLPSALLERRPDVRAAELNIVAANAQIGAAKAQYFPQISLTGMLGVESNSLSNLFKKSSLAYNLAGTAAVPIFTAGRISSQVDLARGQTEEALAAYQQAVRTAFTEVSDSLIEYAKRREQRSEQESLVGARERSVRLSQLRYEGGLDTYLQVLDAETRLFDGQLQLADLKRDELTAVVRLYRALGGGWSLSASTARNGEVPPPPFPTR